MDSPSVGNRILVVGCPGSGKSTFARRLHALTGLPLFPLDSIWWNPDRTHITRKEFDRKLAEILRGKQWIIDGNFSRTYEIRLRTADTVFFLDVAEEECLRGIRERVGKEHPDLPWTEQTLDPALAEKVYNFGIRERPALLALLNRYPDKKIMIFRTRAEADEWLRDRL